MGPLGNELASSGSASGDGTRPPIPEAPAAPTAGSRFADGWSCTSLTAHEGEAQREARRAGQRLDDRLKLGRVPLGQREGTAHQAAHEEHARRGADAEDLNVDEAADGGRKGGAACQAVEQSLGSQPELEDAGSRKGLRRDHHP